jgi:hypothetical protein
MAGPATSGPRKLKRRQKWLNQIVYQTVELDSAAA